MKLHISMLAGSLVITASMHGMGESGEKTPLYAPYSDTSTLPVPQPLPNDCRPKDGLTVGETSVPDFQFRRQSHLLKQRMENNARTERQAACGACLTAICCCPCYTVAGILECICPNITINCCTK